MPAMGHEERFLPPSLSARYEFRKETIAGTHGNERDAPTPVVRKGTFRVYGTRQVRADALNSLSYRNVQLK